MNDLSRVADESAAARSRFLQPAPNQYTTEPHQSRIDRVYIGLHLPYVHVACAIIYEILDPPAGVGPVIQVRWFVYRLHGVAVPRCSAADDCQLT